MNWKRYVTINFGHVGSISTSCEEFDVWGKALIVSSKVEGLPTWTKNPLFPPPQPLYSQTTKCSHLDVFEWFETKNMKLNKEKCHLLVLGHKYENVWVKMVDEKIWESAKQELLGTVIGRNLNFDDHVISLYQKVGRKLAVLARLSKFMSFK